MAKQGREKIITASFILFLNKGYHNTSLKDIIEATNSSKGAIYHHFKSKHDIYLESLNEYFFKLYENVFIEDSMLSLAKRIKNRYQFFADLIDYVEKSGEGTTFPIRKYFLFQLESEKDENIRLKIEATFIQYRNELERLIRQAILSNEITIALPPSVIAQQLMSMIEGITIHNSILKKNSKSILLLKYYEVIQPYISLITNKTLL